MSTVIGIAKFELLFRRAVGLDVGKSDLKRMNEFITQKLYDLLLIGQAVAKANNRDILEPWDLPITKGLQETIHEYKRLDMVLDIAPILEKLTPLPQMDRGYSSETQSRIPEIVGGLILCLAKTFKILDPDLKSPQDEHWETATAIFNTVL